MPTRVNFHNFKYEYDASEKVEKFMNFDSFHHKNSADRVAIGFKCAGRVGTGHSMMHYCSFIINT